MSSTFSDSGVSNNKCSDIYPGPEAFSEIETRNMRDFVLGLSPTPVIAKAVHSAAELWLYPYGWAVATYPDNVDEIVIDAIAINTGLINYN